MDEFVTEIQNISVHCEEPKQKSIKLRDLFNYILSSSPCSEIKITGPNECGDMSFELPMGHLGLSYDVLLSYKKEISSELAANFIGELLVRENIDKFAKLIVHLKDDYKEKVNRAKHVRFGLTLYRDRIIIYFHVSLIQTLLTEDFRRTMV